MIVFSRRYRGSFCVALLLSALAAPTTFAQSTSTPSAGQSSVLDRIRAKMKEMKPKETEAERWFNNLDLDKDEQITKNELFENLRRRFSTLDKNRDKLISKSEYLSVRGDGQLGESRFGALDTNKDAFLTMEEFASPADWRFDRIDRNLDGKISRSEAERLFDRPKGRAELKDDGVCFYVDRQVIRVRKELAEDFLKKGYPKAECEWVPDATEEEKAREKAAKLKPGG